MAHALTLQHPFIAEHRAVLTVSLLLHAGVVLLLVLNLDFFPPREAAPVRLAIQARVVDERALSERSRASEARRREELRADIRRRQEALQAAESARADERAVAEESRQAAEQARAANARETAARRTREADERRAKEATAAASRKAAAEAARRAEADRRSAQTKADLARQLAEEEELLAAADSGLLDQYTEVIRQKVERNWIRPGSAREGINCVVLVKQIPGGEVVDVRVSECNGDSAVVRSIEAAVLRASPLPPPPDRSLFERSLRFNFRPRD